MSLAVIFNTIFNEITSHFERGILTVMIIFILLFVYFTIKDKKSFRLNVHSKSLVSLYLDMIYGENTKVIWRMSTKIIDKTTDSELISEIEKNLFIKYCTDFDNMYKIVKKWNQSRQYFYTLNSFNKCIRYNGGFEDFYHISDGKLNNIICRALKEVGLVDIALIVEKANIKYDQVKVDYIQRFNTYEIDETEKIPKPKFFTEFNKELYKLYNEDVLKSILIQFVRKNKKDFID
jgi:hypothetical protein